MPGAFRSAVSAGRLAGVILLDDDQALAGNYFVLLLSVKSETNLFWC